LAGASGRSERGEGRPKREVTGGNVASLGRRIRALERSRREGAAPGEAAPFGPVDTGWSLAVDRDRSSPAPGTRVRLAPVRLARVLLDRVLLDRGAVHEWYVEESAGSAAPPLCLLAHLAGRALDAGPGSALWVGKRCWPHPRTLIRAGGADPSPLRRSVFVDPPPDARGGGGVRFWAIDVALRSSATAVVVADGAGLDMATSRRFQLAAEAGGRAIGLIARPAADRGAISAATTRWSVRPVPTADRRPRWRVTLERWKGGAAIQPGNDTACELVWDDDAGALLPATEPATGPTKEPAKEVGDT